MTTRGFVGGVGRRVLQLLQLDLHALGDVGGGATGRRGLQSLEALRGGFSGNVLGHVAPVCGLGWVDLKGMRGNQI